MATVPPQHQKALAVRKPPTAAVRRSTRAIESEDDLQLPSWRKLAGADVRGTSKDATEEATKSDAPAATKPDARAATKPDAPVVARPIAKAVAALPPPAPDVGKEKHDEGRSSAAQAARVSGAAEGTARAASPAERKQKAAKDAQDAREGRTATKADRETEETSEARAERAQESARVAARVAAEPAPPASAPPPVKKIPVARPPLTAASAKVSPKRARAAPSKAAAKRPPVLRRGRGPPDAPDRALATAKTSAGGPLPDAVVQAFAEAWGEDFSRVRVHSDAAAAVASELLAAEAFAVGEHLYFAAGRLALQTEAGVALLAHELAHVVQLRNGDLRGLRGVSDSASPAEAAANALVARLGIPTFGRGPPDSPAANLQAATHPREHSRDTCARAPPEPTHAQDARPALVLRRATDQTKAFFDQGYFQQASAWSGATTELDAALSTDAASDTATFPTPTASLGPEQAPERPAVAAAPALALEGEIPIPTEAEALTVTGEGESLADAPQLPSLGHLSAGAEGDTSAAQAQLDNALDDVPTNFDVAISPGERPPVSLEGGADPAQTAEQETVAHDQAEALRAQAAQGVEQGPGPEQVQPTSYHETMPVAAAEPGTLEPLAEIPEMAKLQADPIPEEVRAETDVAGQEQLQASLAEADAALDAAATDHDARREQEVTRAEEEQERVNAEATRAQDTEVQRARGEIDNQRATTLEQQSAAVGELDAQAAEERALVEGDIDARVESDTQAIEDEYAQAEADAQAEKDRKEAEARAEKAEAERKSEDQSWWESALDAIASFFDALLEAVNAIFDALIEAVGAIIEAAKAAVTAIIDAARDFAVGLVQAFGELLKGLVQDLLGSIFPELAAALIELIDAAVNAAVAAINWIADQLKAALLALLDAIGAAIIALLEAYRAAINAAIAIARAALTGDWAALARMVLEAALKLAGIPPESFYAVANNAMAALDTILSDPGAFVGNVINAVAAGFQAFADNFLTHLQEGFFAWIVGPLGELGITLPATWDLVGIFGLVMQVLGLTREGIRLVITEELGETAGLIFDFVWRYVGALITGGLEGLWNEIKNDLGMLWNMVVDGIKNWLLETIVVQAVIKVATMFNPVGALINALITVWNVYQWLRQNAQRIFGIVQAIVDMIGSIAAGNIQPAAMAVEGALASLIPIAISLLANLLGLGGITDKVREVLEGVRGMVRDAIRSLIRRVKALFTGGPEAEGEEEEEEEEGEVRPVDFSPVSFQVANESGALESHEVYYEVSGEQAIMMAASDGGAPVPTAVSSGELEVVDGPAEQQALAAVGPGENAASDALTAEDPEAASAAASTAQQQLTQVASALEQGGTFPEPIGGPHRLSGPTPPDGEQRQSHHVPARGLGETVAGVLRDVASRLGQGTWAGNADATAMAAAVAQHSSAAGAAAGGDGLRLSAILLRRDTHKEEVHGQVAAGEVLSELASNPGADKIVIVLRRTANALGNFVSVNPRISNWRDFFTSCHHAIQTGQIPQEVIGTDPAEALLSAAEAECLDAEVDQEAQLRDVLTDLNTVVARAVRDAYTAGKSVVESGLSANAAKEGTEQGRQTAISTMDATFQSSWQPIRGPIVVPWN